MADRPITGIELFDILASHPATAVHIAFGPFRIPVVDATHDPGNDRTILIAGEDWLRLEQTEDEKNHRRPQTDPGEP